MGFWLALTQDRHCSPSNITPGQCCLLINTCGLCNSLCFYVVRSLALHPNPNLEDHGVTLCLVSTLRPFWHGWSYQEYKTPADRALGVVESCKLPHHHKLVTPYGAETMEFWPYFYKHWNSLFPNTEIQAIFLYTLVFRSYLSKHWYSGPISINIGILILPFKTLEFWPYFYRHFNSLFVLPLI